MVVTATTINLSSLLSASLSLGFLGFNLHSHNFESWICQSSYSSRGIKNIRRRNQFHWSPSWSSHKTKFKSNIVLRPLSFTSSKSPCNKIKTSIQFWNFLWLNEKWRTRIKVPLKHWLNAPRCRAGIRDWEMLRKKK